LGYLSNFKKLPKVNNHPKGKNSSNLVTLLPANTFRLWRNTQKRLASVKFNELWSTGPTKSRFKGD
jgi:hypothetical protein